MIRGFTCGAFDLLHAGHILMLMECREWCDYLIVGLHVDPSIERPEKNKPIQSVMERRTILRALRQVDEVVTYQTEFDLMTILQTYPIDVRIVGEDWRGRNVTGLDVCALKNITIRYNSREHGFSSSELRQRVWEAERIKRGPG